MGLASLDFGAVGGAVSDIFGGAGTLKSAAGYKQAAEITKMNQEIDRQSTAIQQVQASREIFQVLGGIRSDYAGGGVAMSGSALDVLRSSAAQGSLQKQLLGRQGAINQLNYEQEASAYLAQAAAAKKAGKGGILGGILKGVGAVASAFAFSDDRIKEDIRFLRRLPNGVGVYAFRYKGQPTVFEGLMAREVYAIMPEATREVDGVLQVDYAKVGFEPKVHEVAA